MMRLALVPALALALVARGAAQQAHPPDRADRASHHGAVPHYGKWVSAVLAVTFIGLGAHEHANSDDAFRRLVDTCRADVSQCAIGPSGGYLDAASEDLYQTSLRYARRARVRLLAGQASVLLAAGLFLADRGGHDGGPDNIPYHLAVERRAGGTRVGLRLRF